MKILREKHTSPHAALATAVRCIIEIEALDRADWLVSDELLKRMWKEVDRWSGTSDAHALGIVAPLAATGLGDHHSRGRP